MQRLSLRQSGLAPHEYELLRSLDTPTKIQDYLDTLPMNWEKSGDTHYSPRLVLRERKAHCIEGALLAAAAAYLAKILIGGFALAVFETTVAKLRVFRAPDFIGAALMLWFLATLLRFVSAGM